MKNPDDILTIKLPRDQVGRLVSILDYYGLSDMNRDAIYLSHKIKDEIQFYRKSDIEMSKEAEIMKNLDELLRIKIDRTKEYYEDSKSRFGEFSDITLDYESRYHELQSLLHFVRHPKDLAENLKVYKGEDK